MRSSGEHSRTEAAANACTLTAEQEEGIRHAAVDIWHCNADGVYSDISSEGTLGRTYLRGVQFSDKHGRVTFKTIFPGHYSGRTTHIYARIHINSADRDGDRRHTRAGPRLDPAARLRHLGAACRGVARAAAGA